MKRKVLERDESRQRIRQYLALEGPVHKNQIRHEADAGSHPVVLPLIDELEKDGEIESVAQHPTRLDDKTGYVIRGRKPVKYYDLTSYGVVRLISKLKVDASIFDILAQKYQDVFPGIFDVWPLLNKGKRGIFARERLLFVAGLAATSLKQVISDQTLPKEIREGAIHDVLNNSATIFWDPASQMRGRSLMVTWDAILGKDENLRTRVIEAIIRQDLHNIGLRVMQFRNLGIDQQSPELVRRYEQVLEMLWQRTP